MTSRQLFGGLPPLHATDETRTLPINKRSEHRVREVGYDATFRSFVRVVSAVLFSFLFILFFLNSLRQAPKDVIAGLLSLRISERGGSVPPRSLPYSQSNNRCLSLGTPSSIPPIFLLSFDAMLVVSSSRLRLS